MKTVEIFTLKDKMPSSNCGCGTTSSDSPSGCGDISYNSNNFSISAIMNDFKTKHPGVADFKINQLNDFEKTEFIGRINSLLADKSEDLIIQENNMDFILPKILPLFAVNNKIIAINSVPMGDVLLNAIDSEEQIPQQAGCC